MNHYIVNKDSSLIALNTRTLQGGSTALVYVSTTSEIGQVITIRDVDGFISSPQSILISTVGCSITARPSSIRLQQGFAYVTLKSISPDTWTIINESMFSEDLGDYTVKGLTTASTTVISTVNLRQRIVSNNLIQGQAISVYSSSVCDGTYCINSLGVGTSNYIQSSANIVGSLTNSGGMQVNGSFSTTGYVSLFQSLNISTSLSTVGTIQIGGDIIQSNAANMNIEQAISTGYQFVVGNTLSTGGAVRISTSAVVNRATTVPNLFGTAVRSVRTTVSSLYLSTNSFHASRTDLSVVDPTYTGLVTPVLTIQQGLAAPTTVADWVNTSNLFTNSIGVLSTISAGTLSSLVVTNAFIQNSNGSLTISSIATNAFTFSTLNGPSGLQLQTLSGAQLTTSNAYIEYSGACSTIQTGNAYSDSLTAGSIYTSSLNLGNTQLYSASLSLSTIFISSGIVGSNISSIQLSYGTILNSAGRVETSSTFCITANVSNVSQFYEINSGGASSLSFVGSSIQTTPLRVSSLYINSASTNSIRGVNMQFGIVPSFSTLTPDGLYLIPSTVQGYAGSNPYEYVSGLGTTFSPVLCKASFDRSVYMNLGNISSFSTSYINATMNYRNDGGTLGSAGFRIHNRNTYSTLITFNANPVQGLQKFTLSNYPLDRNFNALATSYYFDNAFTPPLLDDLPNNLIGVGEGSGGTSIVYSSDSGVTWMYPPNSVFSVKASAVAWNGEKWVALGQGTNTVAYSYSGLIWYGAGNSVFTGEGLCAVWNGSLWVAGGSGTNTLAYSYDGITWIGQGSTIFNTQTNGIAWNGVQFVAVGQGTNSIAYSYDGLAWNIVYSPIFSVSGKAVAWGQNVWVAVGQGANTLAYSYDGIVWTPVSGFITGGGLCIAWSRTNSQWVAGGAGTYPLIYSSMGTIWSTVPTSPISTLTGVTWSTQWVLTGASGRFATSGDGVNWSLSAGTQFSGSGLAVCSRTSFYSEPVLYTTGDNYTLAYSIGGTTWNNIQSLISGIASCILWNGTMWLATMTSGYDTILYSYDGISWIGLGQVLFGSVANAVGWNGYMWVAVGDAGTNTIGYSYDGLTWIGLGTSIFSEAGYGVAWGNGLWVATGSGGQVLASSPDGINWTGSGSTLFTAGAKVAYGGRLWVATGSGPKSLAYSTTGLTWFAPTIQPFSIYGFDAAWNGSIWIAVGGGGGPPGANIAYSSDGVIWTGLHVPNISARGITWASNKWYITGATGTDSIVYMSADGLTWTASSSTEYGPAYTLVSKQLYPYGTVANSLTIACGSGAYSLALSTDGGTSNWLALTNPLVTTYCVAWNGSLWVAGGGGSGSPVAYSSNGLVWTQGNIEYLSKIYAIAYNSGKWILVGEGANVWADSTDGINWTSRPVTQNGFFSGSAYGIIGGVGGFIAAGTGGLIYSADGITWSVVSTLFNIAYSVQTNGKQFIALGEGSHSLAVSYDGVSWTGLGTSIFSVKGTGVAYGLTTWVAVGEGIANTIAVSTDGLTWTGLGKSVFSTRGNAIFWNGVNFVATGEGINSVAYSVDGYNWTGLESNVFTAGFGVAGKALLPLQRYSVREPRQYTWRVAGGAVALSQTTVRKITNTNAWDSAVYTAEGLTSSAYLSFTPTSTTIRCMVGLSETPSMGTTPTQLNYAISLNAGLLEIYQLGFLVQTFPSYNAGDVFTIIYNGSNVTYYVNDTVLRSVQRALGAPLYMSCILYTAGTLIKNIEFHRVYQIKPVQPALSTDAVVASTTPGLNVPFAAPFYLTLTSDLIPSQWTFNITAGGTLSNAYTSLYADIYINSTKYWSTNVISNIYLTSTSTYSLSFNVLSAYTYSPGDTMNFRLKGSRGIGDAYVYTNWINAVTFSTLSSGVINTQANPNAVEYLEFFHNSANTGLQSSELSVYLSPVSTNTVSYIDSNYGLLMNTSFVRWNNSLNGVTVENRYNDIQTRSLLYTGGLYNASDPSLKNSIEYVDPNLYMTAIQNIPLKRFSYIEDYRNQYRTVDTTQLGILTSDLEPHFPNMVREAPCEVSGLSTIQTVDRKQFLYAHLAATQALILRVSTLRAKLIEAT
jgi:hypothetical protein